MRASSLDIACPKYFALINGATQRKDDNEFAQYGRAFHAQIAEALDRIDEGKAYDDIITSPAVAKAMLAEGNTQPHLFGLAMAKAIVNVLRWLEFIKPNAPDIYSIEEEFRIEDFVPGEPLTGTPDFSLVIDNECHIFDHKFIRNIPAAANCESWAQSLVYPVLLRDALLNEGYQIERWTTTFLFHQYGAKRHVSWTDEELVQQIPALQESVTVRQFWLKNPDAIFPQGCSLCETCPLLSECVEAMASPKGLVPLASAAIIYEQAAKKFKADLKSALSTSNDTDLVSLGATHKGETWGWFETSSLAVIDREAALVAISEAGLDPVEYMDFNADSAKQLKAAGLDHLVEDKVSVRFQHKKSSTTNLDKAVPCPNKIPVPASDDEGDEPFAAPEKAEKAPPDDSEPEKAPEPVEKENKPAFSTRELVTRMCDLCGRPLTKRAWIEANPDRDPEDKKTRVHLCDCHKPVGTSARWLDRIRNLVAPGKDYREWAIEHLGSDNGLQITRKQVRELERGGNAL